MSKQFSEEKMSPAPKMLCVSKNQGNTKCTMSLHIYHIGGKRILTRSGIMGVLVHWGSLGTGVSPQGRSVSPQLVCLLKGAIWQ